ncbi:hypothetical protein PIROE2DRAFT_20503 [Piromyces sp. E2]|nr:hypothetical protein PIROE2DRAFT_20503 [Piromyces sp. E2]|eukprot:OUM64539.1 hypothetical protein PIROE2DRAFT_20503 [Piromyces sp. E2]
MRFSKVIVALFAASAVYSKATVTKYNSIKDLVNALKDSSVDCAKEMTSYQVCLNKPTSKKDCKAIKSDACAKFYANPNKYVSHCIGNNKISIFIGDGISDVMKMHKETCEKIENKGKKQTTTKKPAATKKGKTSTAASATATAPTAAQANTVNAPNATSAAATSAAATSAVAAATSAAASSAAATSAAATSAAATSAAAAATNAPSTPNTPATSNTPANSSVPVSGAPATNSTGQGSLTSMVSGNGTFPQNNQTNQVSQTSDATKLAFSLFVTIAAVMLSF